MPTPQTITGTEIGLLSYLFEAVGDLLTPAQRQELTDQLTSLRPAGVAPGDLITADLFNGMLNNVNDLLARVAVLEGADGGPVITGISPSGSPIPPNSLMTVIGKNFNIEPNRNVVHVGEATITQFRAGSDDKTLIFSIPDIFTGLPKNVNATVETGGKVSNPFSVSLAAPQRQQIGNFDITAVSSPSGTMLGGADLVFEWNVFADTVLDDELNFQLQFSNLAGATENQWKSALNFEPAMPVPVDARSTTKVKLSIKVPATATQANFALRVDGIDGDATGSSEMVRWVAGAPLQVSSPLSVLDFTIPADDGSATTPLRLVTNMVVNGITFAKGIRVRKGQKGNIRFIRTDARPDGELATYNYSVAPESNAGQWSVSKGPIPDKHENVAKTSSNTFTIELTNLSGNEGATTFVRANADQIIDQGGLDPFKSFLSIPLVIVA